MEKNIAKNIAKLEAEIDCLRSEIRAGKAGLTRVSEDWLREARGRMRRMRRMCRELRMLESAQRVASRLSMF